MKLEIGIVIFNLGQLDMTFMDIGLAMAALALVELVRHNKNKEGLDIGQ